MLDSKTATTTTTIPRRARKGVDWLLAIAAAAVIIAVALAAWQWTSDSQTVPDRASGFEYTTDATTGRLNNGAVTGDYFGNNGEAIPGSTIEPSPVSGFDHNDDTTPGRLNAGTVTGNYFGNNGEAFPESEVNEPPSEFDDKRQIRQAQG